MIAVIELFEVGSIKRHSFWFDLTKYLDNKN
jgi:hypothetical protein